MMSLEEVLEKAERVVLEPERALGKEEPGQLRGVCEGILLSGSDEEKIRVKIGEGAVEIKDLSLDQLYKMSFYVNNQVYEAVGRIRERYRSEAGAVCEIYLTTGLMQA